MDRDKLIKACQLIDEVREHFSEIRGDWTDPRTDCREGSRKAMEAKALIMEIANP